MKPTATSAVPRKVRRLHFSLSTLLCAVALIASGGGLYFRWEPWHVAAVLPRGSDVPASVNFSANGRWCALYYRARKPYLDIIDLKARPMRRVLTIEQPGISYVRKPVCRIEGDLLSVHDFSADERTQLNFVVDLLTEQRVLEVRNECNCFVLAPDQRTLAYVLNSNPSEVVLYDLLEKRVRGILRNDIYIGRVLFPAAAGELITIAGQQLVYWNMAAQKVVRSAPFAGDAFNARVSPQRTRLLYIKDDTCCAIDLATGAEIGHISTSFTDEIIFLDENRFLLRSDISRGALSWELGAEPREVLAGHKLGSPNVEAISSRLVLPIDELQSTHVVFDNANLSRLYQLPGDTIWAFSALSPDGRTLLFSTKDSNATDAAAQNLIYEFRRPESWWGLFWLPESWLALLAFAGLCWSLFRRSKPA